MDHICTRSDSPTQTSKRGRSSAYTYTKPQTQDAYTYAKPQTQDVYAFSQSHHVYFTSTRGKSFYEQACVTANEGLDKKRTR